MIKNEKPKMVNMWKVSMKRKWKNNVMWCRLWRSKLHFHRDDMKLGVLAIMKFFVCFFWFFGEWWERDKGERERESKVEWYKWAIKWKDIKWMKVEWHSVFVEVMKTVMIEKWNANNRWAERAAGRKKTEGVVDSSVE